MHTHAYCEKNISSILTYEFHNLLESSSGKPLEIITSKPFSSIN